MFSTTRGSTYTMDVVTRIIRRVILDDPVHGRNVQTTRRYVGAQKRATLGVAELEKCVATLLLLLLSMEIQYGYIDVVQQLAVKFNTVATVHKHDDLLAGIALKESE